MTTDELLYDRTGHVATLTLNRPERMNAISGPMLRAFSQALVDADRDSDVRVIVITGAGRGFCAGADLTGGGPTANRGGGERLRQSRIDPLGGAGQVILGLRGMEKPVIAAVNGPAAGAGFGLAAACDLRIASTEARFTTVFIKRGLAPDYGSSYFLPRIIGISRATEMFLTGQMLDATEALAVGLVSRVVPPERALKEAITLAATLAEGPPLAMQLTARALNASLQNTLAEHLALEWAGQTVCLASEDAREGVTAWLEKRSPAWKGR